MHDGMSETVPLSVADWPGGGVSHSPTVNPVITLNSVTQVEATVFR